MKDTLREEEIARCNRLATASARLEFLCARTLARVLLARAAGGAVREVVIDESAGKPALAGPGDLRFNLSHCATHVLVGLSLREIGVDVETVRPFNQALARRACDKEELEELARLPGELLPAAFCHLWTAKEACVKVSGAGVSFGLRKVHATLEASGRWADLSWWSLDVGRAARAAVAVRSSGGEGLTCRVGADELLAQSAAG